MVYIQVNRVFEIQFRMRFQTWCIRQKEEKLNRFSSLFRIAVSIES